MIGIRPNSTSGCMKYVIPAEEAPPELRLPGWPEWLVPGVIIKVRERVGIMSQRHCEEYAGTVVSVTPQLAVVHTGRYARTFTRADWWSHKVILVGPDGNAAVPRRPPDLRGLGAKPAPAPVREPLPHGPWATLMPKGISLNRAATEMFAVANLRRVRAEERGGLLLISPDEAGYVLSPKKKRGWSGYQFGSQALAKRLLEAGLKYGRYRLEARGNGYVGEWFAYAWGRGEGSL